MRVVKKQKYDINMIMQIIDREIQLYAVKGYILEQKAALWIRKKYMRNLTDDLYVLHVYMTEN